MQQFSPVRNDSEIRALIRSARDAAERGFSFEAQQFLKQAQAAAPRHPLVLNETAKALLRAGRASEAEKLIAEAIRAERSNPEILYTRAVVLRALSRVEEAMAALEELLTLEPKNMAALFEKASIEEERGRVRAAATIYRTAVQLLPQEFQPPKWMEAPLAHGKELIDADNRAFQSLIDQDLAALRQGSPPSRLKRFDQCVDIFLQKRRIVRQQPSFLFYPDLPAVEFYERDDFRWLDDLEAAADEIRTELLQVLEDEGDKSLDPYVADQPGLNTRYYKDLNRSRRWGVYSLWREGKEYPEHIARCPRTVEAPRRWPKWDVPGSGPTALFSLLAPHTRIPAHSGPVNTRLLAHLALIVPPGCGFRVGGQVREWEPGKAFVFDDSIRHEAWNESDEMRAVLIVDMWSPLLSAEEREFVRQLSKRIEEYYDLGSAHDLGGT